MVEILLASGSAIRQTLLRNAGIAIGVVAHDIDERAVASEAMAAGGSGIALHLAERKALSASKASIDSLVIAADQTLELNGDILSKPADRQEAEGQLRSLSGRDHRLHSAFAIARSGNMLASHVESANLTMRDLSSSEIDWYLDEMGPLALTSVGAYQLEGLGVRLFSKIEGDYFTILGLPMLPLLFELRKLGAISP